MESQNSPLNTWLTALALSVLLHGSLLAAIVYFADAALHASAKPQHQAIKASLATFNPQARPVDNSAKPATVNDEAAKATTEEPAVLPRQTPSISRATTNNKTQQTPPSNITIFDPSVSNPTTAVPTTLAPTNIDPTTIQQVIRDSLAVELGSQLNAWMDACQRQRQRNSLTTCDAIAPEVMTSEKQETIYDTMTATFSSFNRHDTEREVKALWAKIEALQPLLDDDTELGALARQRYPEVMLAFCAVSACKTAANAPKLDPTVSEAIRHDSVVEIIGTGK